MYFEEYIFVLLKAFIWPAMAMTVAIVLKHLMDKSSQNEISNHTRNTERVQGRYLELNGLGAELEEFKSMEYEMVRFSSECA